MSRRKGFKPIDPNLLTKPKQECMVDRVLREYHETKQPTHPQQTSPQPPQQKLKVIHRPADDDADFIHPEETLRDFVKLLKEVRVRYESNVERILLWQDATSDLLHQIELEPSMNAAKGYAAYRKLRDVRIERRKAKTENELIKPVYDYAVAHAELIDQISRVQGDCRSTRERVGNRSYYQRTLHSEIQDF